jgi:hypothetical protein
MKKYIFGAVLSLGILVSPAFTQAAGLTQTQVQAILTLLNAFGADSATIASVTTALNGGAPTATGQSFCHNFNSDLTVGNSGDDVTALNRVLQSSGIDTSGNSSNFDENNAGDIVAFQSHYGIRQTGYVGPLTRAKLNALYGCSNGQQSTQSTNTTITGTAWASGTTPTAQSLGSLIPSDTFVNFNVVQGASNPSPYNLHLTNSSTVTVIFTLSVSNQPSWWNTGYNTQTMTLAPGGVMGVGVSVDATKAGDPGTYTANLVVRGNFSNSPITIPVTLTVVTSSQTTNTVSSMQPHVTATSAKAADIFEMDAGGPATISGTNLAGDASRITSVVIGGIQAAITYTSDNLLYVMVPSSLAAGHSYDMSVTNSRGTSNVVSIKILSNVTSTPVSTVSTPSIHLSSSSGSQVSDSSISVRIGDTFTISGSPQNLQGMSYYYGSGYPTSGYYNRAFFFDQNFGDNNSCGNNEASPIGVWTMTCTAKVPGSSTFYVEIYANGQVYRSNNVAVTIANTSSATAGLTSSQIQAILSLLATFGANSTTVANMTTTLNGGALPSTLPSSGLTSSQIQSILSLLSSFGANSITVASVINVLGTATTGLPTATLSASVNTVASGGKVFLYFNSTNATSCSAPSGNWSTQGAVGGNSITNPITSNTTFSLQCTGSGGTSSLQSVTVIVTPS